MNLLDLENVGATIHEGLIVSRRHLLLTPRPSNSRTFADFRGLPLLPDIYHDFERFHRCKAGKLTFSPGKCPGGSVKPVTEHPARVEYGDILPTA